MSFAKALEEQRAPRRLGDVKLRYEESMLIGETPLPPRGMTPTIAWVVGLLATLLSVASLIVNAPDLATLALVLLAAAAYAAAVRLRSFDRRRRAFVLNFGTNSLRLDFVTPFAGRPGTMVVPFDSVRDVKQQPAPGGACLTVDFVPTPGSKELLREVLVAFIRPEEHDDADRLQRLLTGAFGLGEIPADSPALAVTNEESTFEP